MPRKHLISAFAGLFGEGPADRRERLRQLLAQVGQDALRRRQEEEQQKERELRRDTSETTWYHESSEALKSCRLWIARFSLPRARHRIATAKEKLKALGPANTDSQVHAKRQELYKTLRVSHLLAHPDSDSVRSTWHH